MNLGPEIILIINSGSENQCGVTLLAKDYRLIEAASGLRAFDL